MAHIDLPTSSPGIRGLFDYRPETALPLSHLAEVLLRGDNSLSRGERELIAAYVRLHQLGFAHSVECWRNCELGGGLYGVSLGAAFFGESMFHRQRDASKVALVHLVQRLRERGFELLDTQASTPHLRQFGCVDLSAGEYLRLLRKALRKRCEFA